MLIVLHEVTVPLITTANTIAFAIAVVVVEDAVTVA